VEFEEAIKMLTNTHGRLVRIAVTAMAVAMSASLGLAADGQTTKAFTGAKVNGGTVTHSVEAGRHKLTLSADFKVPDTPDPHWQVIDSQGRVFVLERLKAKGGALGITDRVNTSIVLPAYITDVVKVQIYCAWAEAVLGEAPFDAKIDTRVPTSQN
jgi:hypothetical protein